MDIEQFYDADPRRRLSREVAYGRDWIAGSPPVAVADLFWIEATGELYLMWKPFPPASLPGVGREDLDRWAGELHELGEDASGLVRRALHPGLSGARAGEAEREESFAELGVEVLAVVADHDALDALLAGWQAALGEPDSVGWLRARLAGSAGAPAS